MIYHLFTANLGADSDQVVIGDYFINAPSLAQAAKICFLRYGRPEGTAMQVWGRRYENDVLVDPSTRLNKATTLYQHNHWALCQGPQGYKLLDGTNTCLSDEQAARLDARIDARMAQNCAG